MSNTINNIQAQRAYNSSNHNTKNATIGKEQFASILAEHASSAWDGLNTSVKQAEEISGKAMDGKSIVSTQELIFALSEAQQSLSRGITIQSALLKSIEDVSKTNI